MGVNARITILGTASGISMPGRGHASVALEAGDGLYFFDLGEPVGRAMLEARLPIEKLRAAFVSHMHSDHSGGILQFVKNLHLYRNHPDYLPQVESFVLALPSEAIGPVRDFMAACYMFAERMDVHVDCLPVEVGLVYSDEFLSVRAHPTGHLAGYKEFVARHSGYSFLRCQAFSYEITIANSRPTHTDALRKTAGARIVYSGDLAGVDDIIPVARGADCLVLEFGHLLPLGENLKRLRSLDIGSVVLTHIFPDYNDRASELQEIADEALPGVVKVAADGDVVEVKGRLRGDSTGPHP